MNEDWMRDLFAEMRGEPVPADSLVRVRARVEHMVAEQRLAQRRRWVPFAWAAALAGAAAVLTLVLWPMPPVPDAPRVAVVWPRVAENVPVAARPVPQPVAVRGAAVVPRATVEPLSAMIRIDTADPDVVIFLSGQ